MQSLNENMETYFPMENTQTEEEKLRTKQIKAKRGKACFC